jgi:molecular chaperone GrpE (heat shock protein)
VKEMLTVLDNFERAAAAVKTSTDAEASINNSYQSVGKEMLKVAQLGVPV